MSGLKNTFRRLGNASLGRGYKTSGEKKREKAAKKQSALDEVYAGAQMPDDEMIRRNERRKSAKRRGSRQRNVMTDDETLG